MQATSHEVVCVDSYVYREKFLTLLQVVGSSF